jgi:DnaJ like chaperone protein
VFHHQPDRLRDIVTILLSIALADGHLHPAEEQLIQQITAALGLSNEDYQSCKATFQAAAGEPKVSPYEVLGVPPTATDAEVRTAHRRLVREYHPDVVQSKGLPDDFLKFATDKLTTINEAWATVRKERGL